MVQEMFIAAWIVPKVEIGGARRLGAHSPPWPSGRVRAKLSMHAKAPFAAIFDFMDNPCIYKYLRGQERTLIQLAMAECDLQPDVISRGDLAIILY